jgi:hypothetical protein
MGCDGSSLLTLASGGEIANDGDERDENTWGSFWPGSGFQRFRTVRAAVEEMKSRRVVLRMVVYLLEYGESAEADL